MNGGGVEVLDRCWRRDDGELFGSGLGIFSVNIRHVVGLCELVEVCNDACRGRDYLELVAHSEFSSGNAVHAHPSSETGGGT